PPCCSSLAQGTRNGTRRLASTARTDPWRAAPRSSHPHSRARLFGMSSPSTQSPALSAEQSQRFWDAALFAERFFMGSDEVHSAMRALCKTLEEDGIPYAIAGAMALNAHGYQR